jgi:iron complex transport system permease protein
MTKPRPALGLAFFALLFVLTLLLCPFAGMNTITPWDVMQPSSDSMESALFWEIRVPRVLLALMGGGALALCGVAFQALFRNPLAAPYTLGVGIDGVACAAFLGAGAAMALVYGLTRSRGGFSSSTLLLAGVAVSFSCSSLILFIQYTANMYDSFRLLRWMMGGLGAVGYGDVITLLPFAGLGVAGLLCLVREFNLLATGEEIAQSRGLDVVRAQQIIFVCVSLAVGGVVAVCGPIGFIGIIAPHICRILIGHDHRWLAPAATLFGASFLAISDTIARTAFAPVEIPVGVLTAMLGGPFFLWLLVWRKGSMAWWE